MEKSAKRELTFKALYSGQINKEMNDEELRIFLEANNLKDRDKDEIVKDINEINDKKEEILNKISKNLKDNWSIERISKIDKALLMLAIYEIQYKEIPFKVVINEVVELAKKYGEDTSASFINGVLAKIVEENNSNGKEVAVEDNTESNEQ